jgi:hypothetical protein
MRRMRSFQLLFVCAATWLAALPGSAASISVVTTSNNGDVLEPDVHLYQAGTRNDVWPTGHAQSASNLPPGYYQIEVFLPGFRRYERDLEVFAERSYIRVVLTPSGQAVGELDVRGKVIHAKSYEHLWVLAFPLAGNISDSTQSIVSNTGAFQVATTHPGPYVLVLVRGDSMLGCKRIYVGATNPEVQITAGE